MRREFPSGGVADGYQSNPIQNPIRPICGPSHGKSCLLLSHPARKVVDLARTTHCGESTSRVSILGLLERQLQGRLGRRGYERVKRRVSVAPIASLCHHPCFHFSCFQFAQCLANLQRYLGNTLGLSTVLTRRMLGLFRCSL